MKENICELQEANARLRSRLTAKQSMRIEEVIKEEPDLNSEDQEDDPSYKGLEDSEDTETSLAEDRELPFTKEVRPSNPQPKTKKAHAAS